MCDNPGRPRLVGFDHCMNLIRIRFVRWKRLNLTGIFDKTKPKPTLYVVESNDGLCWAGPHKFQGVTFTDYGPMIYRFTSEQSALAAVQGCGLDEPGHISIKGKIKISIAPA